MLGIVITHEQDILINQSCNGMIQLPAQHGIYLGGSDNRGFYSKLVVFSIEVMITHCLLGVLYFRQNGFIQHTVG
jgi:hypothetical protein